jgi:hypothetical protein
MSAKVIITGRMRSGTTLVSNFLNSNEKFSIYRDFLHVKRVKDVAGVDKINETISNTGKERAKNKHNSMTSKLPVEGRERFFVDEWEWDTVLEYYNEFLDRIKNGDKVVGHKTTQAWNVLEEVLASVPNLKSIYVVRDPRDVVVSSVRKWPYERRGNFENICKDWNEGVEEALTVKRKFENRLYLLKFEDLVLHVNEEVECLQEFLGVPVTVPEELMEYGHSWKSDSSFGKGNSLLNASAVGRWKVRRPWVGKKAEENCKVYMNKFGYEVPITVSMEAYIRSGFHRIPGWLLETMASLKRRVRRGISKIKQLVTS